MKRAISIAFALALTLTMVLAAPASAVIAGTVVVAIDEPIAGDTTDWTVSFQNRAALSGANSDYIDVYFPAGTDASGATVTMGIGATRAAAIGNILALPYAPGAIVLTATHIRIDVGAAVIGANVFVAMNFDPVINPTSCFKTLTVGTSNCCLQTSDAFPIYTAKIELVEDKNLISLPAYPEDTSIEVVLADLFEEAALTAGTATPFTFSVWYWDSWADEWVIYASDTSFSDLTDMEAGKAYFVKVSDDIEFYFKGEPYPECQGPPQVWCYPAGWAMIGPAIQTADIWASLYLKDAMLPWPSQDTYAVSTILSFNEGTQLYENTAWNPGLQSDATWQGAIAGFPALSDYELVQTQGYFMYFLAEACIIPPVA